MGSIEEQRSQILGLLKRSPSLLRRIEQYAAETYPSAVRSASIDTGLPRDRFPKALPYTLEALLDEEFYP